MTFTFIKGGFKNAIKKAKAVAGDKNIMVIGGANTAQQCIKSKLLDEIIIRQMPVILNDGLQLFAHLGTRKIKLERIQMEEYPTRIDIRFRVVNYG